VIVRVVAALVLALALVLADQVGAAQATGTGPAQVITVKAPSSTTTYATVEAWTRTSTGVYRRVYGPWTARVGRSGVGSAYEGSGRTPAGVWPLGQSFGVGVGNPGTALPWFSVDSYDIWGSDVLAPTEYNRHVRALHPLSRSGHYERLINYPTAYRHATFIGYNVPPVLGKGSAFFLHATTGTATAGCVSLTDSQIVTLQRWLKPGGVISIGVGWHAYEPIPQRY
jgi:L,D-peptidoglycan transpeptidase YkuD (ErfK/YbiS/YcfS/YnhG family)